MTGVVKVGGVGQSCFAMEVGGWAKHLSSNSNNSLEKGGESVLTGYSISSLVVDWLCDQAKGQSTDVACFYFDFAARQEQSATSILSSLLKQVVGEMENIPSEISQAFQEQKKVIGGRRLQLPDIVKMLQTITSSLRTFVCIDALEECAVAHRVKLLNSLQQIVEKSPCIRIFMIGRPHIRAEVEKRLAGRVISLSVGPNRDDIMEYLRLRLNSDETPDAMDESLEADILSKIPSTMPECTQGQWYWECHHTQSANRYTSRFLLVSLISIRSYTNR